jgi:hypothetical protein
VCQLKSLFYEQSKSKKPKKESRAPGQYDLSSEGSSFFLAG